MRYFYIGESIKNERQTNMDCLLVKEKILNKNNVLFAVVCDGVGSLKDGGFASSRAVAHLNSWFDCLQSDERLGIELRDAIIRINQAIVLEEERHGLKAATTLSSLLICEDCYYIVHAGDSRIYMYNQDPVSSDINTDPQLTIDHVNDGKLASFLGRDKIPQLFYLEGELPSECTFLLCSDGLYKHLNMENFKEQIINMPFKKAKRLMNAMINTAIENGEKDNITVAIVKECM